MKTWQVVRQTIDNINLRQIADADMHKLSKATGETIYLAVVENLSVVYISKIDSIKPIRSWPLQPEMFPENSLKRKSRLAK